MIQILNIALFIAGYLGHSRATTVPQSKPLPVTAAGFQKIANNTAQGYTAAQLKPWPIATVAIQKSAATPVQGMLPLDITLVYFSGRPDPQWQVQANHPKYQKIREMFNSAVNQELAALPEQMPSQLGYRGFLVRYSNDQLPKLILGTTTKELQMLLLGTIPSDAIPQALVGIIVKTIEDGGVSPIGAELETPGTKRAPKYNLLTQWKWNNWYAVTRNYCYNYATNKMTNTQAQPGKKHGVNLKTIYGEHLGEEVMKAAVKDGLTVPGNVGKWGDVPTRESLGLQPSQHLVALFASNSDFHWYRQDKDNTWSHKPGESKVTNKVYVNKKKSIPINDPREISHPGEYPGGDEYKFVGFMISDKKLVAIS